jgi:NDP-sugar pyrophosphorylase family protein
MKAMIVSAGLGTRFKPWTDAHPKALAPVKGKSLLQRNIEYLQRNGIHEVIVNVHHFAGQVVKAIEKNNGWGSKVEISDESDFLLDTGGGLLKAQSLFTPGEAFITCNADILTDLDIHRLVRFHQKKKALVSFGTLQRETSRYLLFDEDDRLCGWRNVLTGDEKIARPSDVLIQKAYSCVALFEYDFFSLVQNRGKFSLIEAYLSLAKEHRIYGMDHTGDKWVDVGKPGSVEKAEMLF